MKQIIINILLWIWCFPQMLLGLILKVIYKGKPTVYHIDGKIYSVYHSKLKSGSISLGKFILLCETHHNNEITIKHEYGHYIQSLLLGPLYLLVIGIPSFLWANVFWNGKSDYYSFYTEKWANKLGDVKEY